MGNYIYKCVSLSIELSNNEDSLADTIRDYEKILNETAKDGWDYFRTDTISSALQKKSTKSQNEVKGENSFTKILIFKKHADIENENQTKINFLFNELNMKCPSCKSEISEDDLYCENCARKLK